MTDKRKPQKDPDVAEVLRTALNKFSDDVPDWKKIPVTALLVPIEDELMAARDLSFQSCSKKHTEEWQQRTLNYVKAFQRREEDDIDPMELDIRAEMLKHTLTAVGGCLAVCAVVFNLKDGRDPIDEFMELTEDEREERFGYMAGWGDHPYSWITLQNQRLLERVKVAALEYEFEILKEDKDADRGVEAVAELLDSAMSTVLLGLSLFFAVVLDQVSDEELEKLKKIIEESKSKEEISNAIKKARDDGASGN
jgi:hypothetical protein